MTSKSQWTHILSPNELDERYALVATLDPSFASRQRDFYRTRTLNDLKALESQAWLSNNSEGFQLARSHAAMVRS